MKAGIYDALATLNRGFDATVESLKALQDEGALKAEYVQDQGVFVEELRAGINFMILQKLTARETEDREHYGKMRITIEAERQRETTTPTTHGDSGSDTGRENA